MVQEQGCDPTIDIDFKYNHYRILPLVLHGVHGKKHPFGSLVRKLLPMSIWTESVIVPVLFIVLCERLVASRQSMNHDAYNISSAAIRRRSYNAC